jgi:hypothetical protein
MDRNGWPCALLLRVFDRRMLDHVYSAIDTSQTYSFRQSPWRSVQLLLLGAVMVVASAFVAFGGIQSRRMGGLLPAIGIFGIIFFGAAMLVIISRLLTIRGPVLTISPAGVRDIRIAAETIPWRAIQTVGTWSVRRQAFVVLSVAPEIERGLRQTRMARWTRSANRAIGADGLFVSTSGLDLDHADLLRLIMAHLSPDPSDPDEYDENDPI